MADILPYNDNAEKAVLGALLMGGDINIPLVEVKLKAEDFYLEANRAVYKAMIRLYELGKQIDFVTVDSELQGNPNYGGAEYLKQLAGRVPTNKHIKYYAEIISELAKRRFYIALAQKIQQLAGDITRDITTVNDAIEEAVSARAEAFQMRSFVDLYAQTYCSIVKAYEKKGEIPGQRTGWVALDSALGGLEGLVVVGARPGMGKTVLGVNMAEYVALRENKPALIFSLEMDEQQLMLRIISSQTHVKHSDCRFGTLSEDDFCKISEFGDAFGSSAKLQIIDYEKAGNISDIKSISRYAKRKYGGLGLIIVDYIQLLCRDDRRKTKAEQLGDISRSLKLLSKELGCPIVALSQLTRNTEKNYDKRPSLSDLRDSGAIEQDADSVLLIYREEYYNPDTKQKNIAEIIIAKARHGQTGTIKLAFLPEYMKFCDIRYKQAKKPETPSTQMQISM